MVRNLSTCVVRAAVAALLTFGSVGVRAEAGGGKSLVKAPTIYTPQVLGALKLEDLLRLNEEMLMTIRKVTSISERADNASINYDDIRSLGQFHVYEAQQVLHILLRTELKKTDTAGVGVEPDIFIVALETLASFGTLKPTSLEEDIRDMMKEADRRLGGPDGHPFSLTLAKKLEWARGVMAKNFDRLPEMQALIDRLANAAGAGTHARMKRMREILERQIIGQPEVIEGVLDMEWRTQLYGKNRLVPDAIYLMGLPGTGKDTTAQGLTDALHGFDGAYHNHMFRMPLMKNQADLWKVMGSATGYIGSEGVPPLLAFLIQHAGGRYKLESIKNEKGENTEKFMVIKNPEWKGETLPGYFAPEKAVVFVNEFHNWSKQLKDDFLKQALEKGYFSINNPNGGEAEIYVPVRFVIATNEGINLITSREANGQRHGKPLTYPEVLAKWEAVRHNKAALKGALLATNGTPNSPAMGNAPGISEELLSRIDNGLMFMMRPMSPESLRQIGEIKLRNLSASVGAESNLLGKNEISWSAAVADTLQSYEYEAEEGTRSLEGRLKSLIENPLIDLIKTGNLKQGQLMTKIDLDIRVNEDLTRSLIITVQADLSPPVRHEQLIRETEKDRPRQPISDERIDRLAGLEHEMKSAVFGIDPILERLSQRVISIENSATSDADRPASVIMLDGLSSTGKTETAKQLARKLTGNDDELVTFDFSQIQTLHDFKREILGLDDGFGNPIPSRFMKEYDRRNGQIIVAFDELANVRDPDLLKVLYDFFREPVVSTFSDHRPRKMAGVKVIVTGNASQGLYTQVPSDIPLEAQMQAWQQIYEHTSKDYALQRRVLLKTYSEALLNRIGKNNIFFVPPHTYKSLRQLAQLKLGHALDRLRDTKNSRGWDIVFPNSAEYSRFVDVIIDEGFSLREQGASIDTFIRDDVETPLDSLLLRAKVPSGTRVVLNHRATTDNHDREVSGLVTYDVFVEGRAEPLQMSIQRPYVKMPLKPDQNILMTTAAHEAGHSIARQALFPGAFIPTGVSVIPGVTMIGDQWIYYLGLAEFDPSSELSPTRDFIVRNIAVLMAGETAERLVTQNEITSAGKQNDIERATTMARHAVIKFGLSPKWGLNAVPTGQKVEDYLDSLPERQKSLLYEETQNLLNEGRALAQRVLEANFDYAFMPLTLQLAEQGRMKRKELETFYAEHPRTDPTVASPLARMRDRLRTRLRKMRNPRRRSLRVELDKTLARPRKVADVPAMAEARKRAQFDEVPLPDRMPIGSNPAYDRTRPTILLPSPGRRASCAALLEKAG